MNANILKITLRESLFIGFHIWVILQNKNENKKFEETQSFCQPNNKIFKPAFKRLQKYALQDVFQIVGFSFLIV